MLRVAPTGEKEDFPHDKEERRETKAEMSEENVSVSDSAPRLESAVLSVLLDLGKRRVSHDGAKGALK